MQINIKRPEALLQALKESLLKSGSQEINALIEALEAVIPEWVLKDVGNIYNTRTNRIYTPAEVVGLLNDKVSCSYKYEHSSKPKLTVDDFLWEDDLLQTSEEELTIYTVEGEELLMAIRPKPEQFVNFAM